MADAEDAAERACDAFECGSFLGGGFVVVMPLGDVYGIFEDGMGFWNAVRLIEMVLLCRSFV